MQHATNRITISFVLIYPALFRLIPWFPTFCVLRGRQHLTSNAKKKKRAKARAKAAAAQAAAAQAAQESAALSFEPQPQPDEEFNIQHLDEYDDESKSAVLKKEIKDFSRTNPDVVAQLIRSMMKNGE